MSDTAVRGGGVEESLFELVLFLPGVGIVPSVAAFVPVDLGPPVSAEPLAEVAVERLVGETLIERVHALRRIIRSRSVDVVHTAKFQGQLAARLAARLSGVPLLATLVGEPPPRRNPSAMGWRRRLTSAFDRKPWLLPPARFQALSRAVRDSWVASGRVASSRVSIVTRGRDPARFPLATSRRRLEARRRLQLPLDASVIVNVARQDPAKGQVHLVDAFARVATRDPRSMLLIAGRESSAAHALRSRVLASPVADRIHILGHRDDIGDILTASDIFAFPSLQEGLGGAVLEALATGIAVVLSDIPALRELVDPTLTQCLVPAGDPVALADTILELLRDERERARRSTLGHQLFEQRYTIAASASHMAELYRQLAASGRRARRLPRGTTN